MFSLQEIQDLLYREADNRTKITDMNDRYLSSLYLSSLDAISQLIRELKDNKSELSTSSLLAHLQNGVRQYSMKIQRKTYHKAMQQIDQYLKVQIESLIANCSQDTRRLYEDIYKRNKDLCLQLPISSKIKAEFQINQLIAIDILSYFLYHNQRYKHNCLTTSNLWKAKQLQVYLPLSLKTIQKMMEFHQDVQNFITYKFSKKLRNLIDIYAIIKLTYRITIQMLMKKQEAREELRVKTERLKKLEDKIMKEPSLNIKESNKYMLSQIALCCINSEEEVKTADLQITRNKIIQLLLEHKVKKLTIYPRKWLILRLKLLHKISFGTIFKILEDKLFNFLDHPQQIDKIRPQLLEIILQYRFVRWKKTEQGIKNCALSEYGVEVDPKQFHIKCPNYVKSCFLKVLKSMKTDINLLKYKITVWKKSHMSIISFIKYEFSYQKLKNIPFQKGEDIVVTVILGMKDDKRIFLGQYNGHIGQSEYIKDVKETLKKQKEVFHALVFVCDEKEFFHTHLIKSLTLSIRNNNKKSSYFVSRPNHFSVKAVSLCIIIAKIIKANQNKLSKISFKSIVSQIITHFFSRY